MLPESDERENYSPDELEVLREIHAMVDQVLLKKIEAVIREHTEDNEGLVTVTSTMATLSTIAYILTAFLHDGGMATKENAEIVAMSIGNYIHFMTLQQFEFAEARNSQTPN